MSQILIQNRYVNEISPFDALLQNPCDEEAWYSIFGDRLREKICRVVIKQRYRVVERREQETDYRRECLAFC